MSFRRLFMPPLFPVDIRDADHAGQSSLQLVGHTEFGDLKFPAPELHGPPGLLQYWMGHAGEGMSDLYDKIKGDVRFRKEVQKKPVWVSSFPTSFRPKPRYWTEWTETRKIPA